MSYRDTISEINNHRAEMTALRKKMRELQASIEPEEVEDYTFSTTGEDVKLSSLFGDKDTLFVIHNMGKSCVHCTQWADGFNGSLRHLEDRAAFVVSSPDLPQVQNEFAGSRNWQFTMVSHNRTSFAKDMGYHPAEGYWPGVSVFKKDGNKILRVSDTQFGPGDDFNAEWNLFALIPEGPDGWEPKYTYD